MSNADVGLGLTPDGARGGSPLSFRDPARARALGAAIAQRIERIARPVKLMHVCGSHEQAIARFGLRDALPAGLEVIMGPGCPVCVTDAPEVDEAVALALQGVRVATFGDMLRVPGTRRSLADAQAAGARVEVVYSIAHAAQRARELGDEPLVFFASGFETTAVTTAAAIVAGLPANLSVLSAHKFIPPAMELVAAMPGHRVEGFLAAGHAATITGWGVFRSFVARHRVPVVVAGFEPLDILAALLRLIELVERGEAAVVNGFPRCVTEHGNRAAQQMLWRVFETESGQWRGIAEIPAGNLRLRAEFAHVDARRRLSIDLRSIQGDAPSSRAADCICGEIMAGIRQPLDCTLFGAGCSPEEPVGACMVSSEGTCRIWHQYGGRPRLRSAG